MGGGLFQLVCRGQQDNYLCNNPDMSFFKYSYKKHTNFAMEHIRLDFNNIPIISPDIIDAEYICKITRNADLLKNLYFCCTLPKIYSSSNTAFKWVKNIGNILVKKAVIKIDGNIIDNLTSNWLNIWNELTMDNEGFDFMIGNIATLNNPSLVSSKKIVISNNKFLYNYYPNSSIDNIKPSIDEYNLTIPLPFWFTKNQSLALPLLRLQYQEITLVIQLEHSENLYTVYSNDLEENISPLFYNQLYENDLTSGIKARNKININTFTKSLDIKPYIEAVYIYLDEEERNEIFRKPTITYLIEQLEITPQNIIPRSLNSTVININSTKPVKEIIWVTRREDYISNLNAHTNYTASIRQNNDYGIMDRASIIFDKSKLIVDDKKDFFFNKLQPYQHHSNIPKYNGIYIYSFALYPEKNNPSGYYNSALVKTQLSIYTKQYLNEDPQFNLNTKLNINNKFTELNIDKNINNYTIDIYTISYNIFEIIGNTSGLKFA